MKKFYRALIVVFVFFLIGMGLLAIRYFFDQRDMKAARELVLAYRFCPKPEKTLGQMMADHGSVTVESLACQTTMLSRYEKKFSVICFEKEEDTETFIWSVDLSNQSVLPENATAKELVAFCYTDEQPVKF
jgi:hypothetical protein